jgi:hypothetical protein
VHPRFVSAYESGKLTANGPGRNEQRILAVLEAR